MADDIDQLLGVMQELTGYLRVQHHKETLDKYPRRMARVITDALMIENADKRELALKSIATSVVGTEHLTSTRTDWSTKISRDFLGADDGKWESYKEQIADFKRKGADRTIPLHGRYWRQYEKWEKQIVADAIAHVDRQFENDLKLAKSKAERMTIEAKRELAREDAEIEFTSSQRFTLQKVAKERELQQLQQTEALRMRNPLIPEAIKSDDEYGDGTRSDEWLARQQELMTSFLEIDPNPTVESYEAFQGLMKGAES
jgi:hypothetical protein